MKTDWMLMIFTFNYPPKRRKLNEAWQAKAKHKYVLGELLEKQNTNVATAFPEPGLGLNL